MSAIARLLLARGASVTGSDVHRSDLVSQLETEGAIVAIGHCAENVGHPDLVIVSSAIAHDNPEFVAAIERGIDIKTRGAMLAELTGSRKTIAIAGTNGKTTTTAMTVTILEHAKVEPTYAIGGLRVDTVTNAGTGAGVWFVTESDESDGSFLHLQPTIAVVTNVENDHLSSDDELPGLLAQFSTFVQRVPPDGCAIIGLDDRGSAFIAKNATVPKTTFAIRTDADVMARDIVYDGLGSRFTLVERGNALGTVHLHMPGEINVLNALAAIAVARTLKVDVPTIAAALDAFRGVRRRFEIVGEHGGVTIVDDYAHHPTAIAQTIAAARGYTGKPIVVAFQPHRYSRTRYLAADFAAALANADAVVLAPIYAASEAPIEGVSERSIGVPLAATGTPVTYVSSVDQLLEEIPRVCGDDAVVLMLGAGSISGVAHRLGATLGALPAALRRPLAPRCSPVTTGLRSLRGSTSACASTRRSRPRRGGRSAARPTRRSPRRAWTTLHSCCNGVSSASCRASCWAPVRIYSSATAACAVSWCSLAVRTTRSTCVSKTARSSRAPARARCCRNSLPKRRRSARSASMGWPASRRRSAARYA